MAFNYLKVKSAKCLCLLAVVLVLVLLFWSCKQRSWSYEFGLVYITATLAPILGMWTGPQNMEQRDTDMAAPEFLLDRCAFEQCAYCGAVL